MQFQTKLQVCAGIGAVTALPIIYSGLSSDGRFLPWLGIALFGTSMMVMPLLRVLPSSFYEDRDDV